MLWDVQDGIEYLTRIKSSKRHSQASSSATLSQASLIHTRYNRDAPTLRRETITNELTYLLKSLRTELWSPILPRMYCEKLESNIKTPNWVLQIAKRTRIMRAGHFASVGVPKQVRSLSDAVPSSFQEHTLKGVVATHKSITRLDLVTNDRDGKPA